MWFLYLDYFIGAHDEDSDDLFKTREHIEQLRRVLLVKDLSFK